MKPILYFVMFFCTTTVWSFSSPTTITKSTQHSSLYYYPQKFDRAVECANEYGLCDFDELGQLADGKKYTSFNFHIHSW